MLGALPVRLFTLQNSSQETQSRAKDLAAQVSGGGVRCACCACCILCGTSHRTVPPGPPAPPDHLSGTAACGAECLALLRSRCGEPGGSKRRRRCPGTRAASPLVTACVQVGAYHLNVKIDSVVAAMTNLFAAITGRMPRFRCEACCSVGGRAGAGVDLARQQH